jgi:hypothetical protein
LYYRFANDIAFIAHLPYRSVRFESTNDGLNIYVPISERRNNSSMEFLNRKVDPIITMKENGKFY